MQDNYYEEKTSETSKYNEAGLQIMRLHEFWLKAELYANKGWLRKWNFVLDSIYRELYADLLRSDDKEKLDLKYSKIIKILKNSQNQIELYNNLNKKHFFLKELQDSAGKGAKYIATNYEDFE